MQRRTSFTRRSRGSRSEAEEWKSSRRRRCTAGAAKGPATHGSRDFHWSAEVGLDQWAHPGEQVNGGHLTASTRRDPELKRQTTVAYHCSTSSTRSSSASSPTGCPNIGKSAHAKSKPASAREVPRRIRSSFCEGHSKHGTGTSSHSLSPSWTTRALSTRQTASAYTSSCAATAFKRRSLS